MSVSINPRDCVAPKLIEEPVLKPPRRLLAVVSVESRAVGGINLFIAEACVVELVLVRAATREKPLPWPKDGIRREAPEDMSDGSLGLNRALRSLQSCVLLLREPPIHSVEVTH